MKTNIIMQSEKDRELYGVVIRQETKTCFMSLSDLQEAYTHARVLNGWSEKRIDHILKYDENIERIYYLLAEQKIINVGLRPFMEKVKEDGIFNVLKKLEVYKTTGRGENKNTMCNLYIWVLVAMEMNPQLYAKVITWITDKLIFNRLEAGDLCKSLNSALKNKIQNPDYARIAIEINKKIAGEHYAGIRNFLSKDQLKEMARLEDNIAFAINNGYICSNADIIQAINK